MTPKERAVMQQALEALEELLHSNSTKVAVEKYDIAHSALLEALEQPDEIAFIETNRALAKEIIELKKQAEQEPVGIVWDASAPVVMDSSSPKNENQEVAELRQQVAALKAVVDAWNNVEQEPVAWLWKPSKPFPQYTVITDKKEYLKAAKEQGVEITPLYAAPVRTKDLTDDEVADCGDFAGVFTLTDLQFARAVIAADREKNK